MLPLSHKDREMGELYRALAHAASLVLEGVALHAVEIEGNERAAFQRWIRQHAEGLAETEGVTPADMMVSAGAAIQAMEVFTRRTEQQIHGQIRELKSISHLLFGTLIGLARENPLAVADLQKWERQLEDTSKLEEIHIVRSGLATCLALRGKDLGHVVKPEVALDLSDAARVVRSAEQDSAEDLSGEHLNPVTMLPGKEPAARAINRAQALGYWAAVPVAVERMDTLIGRFGQHVADEVLFKMAQILAQKLKPTDQIFHLRGGVFLMLVKRSASAEAIRAEMARTFAERIEHTFSIGERTIILPLSLSWVVLPLWQQANMEEIQEQVEKFVGNPSGKFDRRKSQL